MCLITYPCDWQARRRSKLTKLAPTTTANMTHDVFYTSDPDTQGRCSVRLPLQAKCVWGLCVWGLVNWCERVVGGRRERGDQVREKINKLKNIKSLKYLRYWPCVVTFLSQPRPTTKMGSTEVHVRGPAPSTSTSLARQRVVMTEKIG